MMNKNEELNLAEAISDISAEVYRARSKFPAFNSRHEGVAVLQEEVDELWEEVKKKAPMPGDLRREAIQVAAMAARFAAEIPAKGGV